MQRDGLLFLKAFMELCALQHLRNSKVRRQANDAFKAEGAKPFRVEADLGFVAIKDAKDLLGVGLRVLVDLFRGQRFARGGAAGRVTDQRSKIAD